MKQKFNDQILLLIFFLFITFSLKAQDPNRYNDQVAELVQKEYNFDAAKKRVVFAGSSSVRMWKDVQDYYPGFNVVNNGFGGSHFSDLLYFYDKLILKHNPDILFIYEGDNDIAGDKKPGEVFKDAKELFSRIRQDLPETKVICIAAKPSIARESFKQNYEKLNRKLEKYCKRKDNLEFADVWNAMLDENGDVLQDVFIKDGLHMNKKGYDIWGEVLSEFMK